LPSMELTKALPALPRIRNKQSKIHLVKKAGGGLPVDVGAQDVEHGREAIIGGE
jgi:hypothetical protein